MDFLSRFKVQRWKKNILQSGAEISKIIKPTQIYRKISPLRNIGKKLTEHPKSVSFSESKYSTGKSLQTVRKRKLLRGRLNPAIRLEGFRTPEPRYGYTLEEYKNQERTNYYMLGGLGPVNIGTESWKWAKQKRLRMDNYSRVLEAVNRYSKK